MKLKLVLMIVLLGIILGGLWGFLEGYSWSRTPDLGLIGVEDNPANTVQIKGWCVTRVQLVDGKPQIHRAGFGCEAAVYPNVEGLQP